MGMSLQKMENNINKCVTLKTTIMKAKYELEGEKNYVTSNIIDCVNYWNREGIDVYSNNITGEYGSKETNEKARKTVYDDFILDMLLIDCRTFCNSKYAKESSVEFECGRTRSHIWVHMLSLIHI